MPVCGIVGRPVVDVMLVVAAHQCGIVDTAVDGISKTPVQKERKIQSPVAEAIGHAGRIFRHLLSDDRPVRRIDLFVAINIPDAYLTGDLIVLGRQVLLVRLPDSHLLVVVQYIDRLTDKPFVADIIFPAAFRSCNFAVSPQSSGSPCGLPSSSRNTFAVSTTFLNEPLWFRYSTSSSPVSARPARRLSSVIKI